MVLDALKKALYIRLFPYLRSYFLSRRIYSPPDVEEICHYAVCIDCIRNLEAQGWKVGYRERDGVVSEVFFMDGNSLHFTGQCVRGEKDV